MSTLIIIIFHINIVILLLELIFVVDHHQFCYERMVDLQRVGMDVNNENESVHIYKNDDDIFVKEMDEWMKIREKKGYEWMNETGLEI